MKHLFVAISFLVSATAFAHLEPGVYTGIVAGDATACSFTVKAITFNGIKHPLNERVEIDYEGMTFILSHLPTIDLEGGMVSVDRDRLSGANGIDGGSMAAVLKMDHSSPEHRVGDFTFMHNDARRSMCHKIICTGLKHESERR